MRITEEFLNSLTPVEISFIMASINKLSYDKIKHETTNYENLNPKVERCPHCGSRHFVRNGFNPKKRQKYLCKECHSVFMATTGTMFSHSQTTFDIWGVFIAGDLNGLTLEQQSVATELTVTTCFNMRHKLYKAASRIQKDVKLKGLVALDPSYTSINLKGTKPENMPRASKHRGHKSKSVYSRHLCGISNHKVCLLAAIDENDKMVFTIAGLGEESKDKLDVFKFSESIPVIANKVSFTTDNGNSLGSANELHTEAKDLIRHKRGISTRHLQGYLDWLVFRKNLKYRLSMKKWRPEVYMETMQGIIPFICPQICKLEMPVDLYKAYGSYHYGIYSLIN